MRARALSLLVFREDRRCVRGAALKTAMLETLEALGDTSSPDQLTGALLRAGELECALTDAAGASSLPTAAEPFRNITDRLAEDLLSRSLAPSKTNARGSARSAGELREIFSVCGVPEEVEVAAPEGFAYYALHPLAYAEVLDTLPSLPFSVAVVGIRSIGSTLSAITAAALRTRGVRAGRITVRPVGHPYDRRTQFLPAQMDFIRQHVEHGSNFWVVDEGPGLSGSSFLSVAEALIEAGVPRETMILICGHAPSFDSFCAEEGPQRARKFRWLAVSPEPRRPAEAKIFVGGGEWRKRLYCRETAWPESWTTFERLKYLSSREDVDGRLFKFIGLGHYGKRVLDREKKVAIAGFGLPPSPEQDGFVSYPWIAVRPMSPEDLSRNEVERLAAYCAFRASAFAEQRAQLTDLQQMAEHNLHEMGFAQAVRLRLERPVLADGRMQPHEWLVTPRGEMLKTDSGSHGDDHFFPGLTDIAWDLAGAIVEWKMSGDQAVMFLDSYRRASGDDPRSRIADFVLAYSAFRSAYCKMAANALQGSDEHYRLELAAAGYAACLDRSRPCGHSSPASALLSGPDTGPDSPEIKPISTPN